MKRKEVLRIGKTWVRVNAIGMGKTTVLVLEFFFQKINYLIFNIMIKLLFFKCINLKNKNVTWHKCGSHVSTNVAAMLALNGPIDGKCNGCIILK